MMPDNKISFKNEEGVLLSGRLDLPADREPHNFAIFAHCFTCNKNFHAVRNVSRALTLRGFGVLQFDFTGLGDSQGEFSKSNFSGNIEDIIAASKFLEREYESPGLIIGHSLGGIAAIFAASRLESIQAVATIGSPSSPQHIKHLLQNDIEEIKQTGQAVVNIGDRSFTIKKQFLDDIASTNNVVNTLRKAILILHSPQDAIVNIDNAAELYQAAHHPKSFISLDGADHLLSDEEDSLYAGEVIASWAKRYLPSYVNVSVSGTHHQVAALLQEEDTFTTSIKAGKHFMTSDEPLAFNGHDLGPSPYEFLGAGLAACTAMTLKMYSSRKKWPLKDVEVFVSYKKEHAEDCKNEEDEKAKIDVFEREIKLYGDLDQNQRKRLLEIANKCPVHKTLTSQILIRTLLIN